MYRHSLFFVALPLLAVVAGEQPTQDGQSGPQRYGTCQVGGFLNESHLCCLHRAHVRDAQCRRDGRRSLNLPSEDVCTGHLRSRHLRSGYLRAGNLRPGYL